jgi:hypothetical protein
VMWARRGAARRQGNVPLQEFGSSSVRGPGRIDIDPHAVNPP